MPLSLPQSWQSELASEIGKPYFRELEVFVDGQRAVHEVFPAESDVFNALSATAPDRVRVVILGQDPYHDVGQAHGMAFSVCSGIKPPPSLVNIFAELRNDVGCKVPNNGYLVPWAVQGVLLLNAVLTVRAHEPNSHKNRGWEKFTDAVLRVVNERGQSVIFVLWGNYAHKKEQLIDTARHTIIKSAHPSPLSARNGFFGSRPFSQINSNLTARGQAPVNWQLPDVGG
jgi:uracil-DNA glycosylase